MFYLKCSCIPQVNGFGRAYDVVNNLVVLHVVQLQRNGFGRAYPILSYHYSFMTLSSLSVISQSVSSNFPLTTMTCHWYIFDNLCRHLLVFAISSTGLHISVERTCL